MVIGEGMKSVVWKAWCEECGGGEDGAGGGEGSCGGETSDTCNGDGC